MKKKLMIICLSALSSYAIAQSNLTAFGSKHYKLGKATLSTSGDNVVLSNIGSSGNDGAKISFKAGDYHVDLAEQSYPVGSEVKLTSIGNANQKVESITINRSSTSSINITPDFSSIGSTTYKLEIYDDELGLVYAQGGLSGGFDGETPAIQFPIRGCKHKDYFDYPNGYTYYFTLRWVGFKDKSAITTPTGTVVEGAMLVIRPENPTVFIDDYSEVHVTAKNVPSITIEKEWLIRFEDHISFTTFDETDFKSELNGDIVVKDNSSDQYITRVEYLEFLIGEVQSAAVDMSTSNFNALGESSSLTYNVVADVELTTATYGTVSLEKENDGMNFSADFSSIGSPVFEARYYRGGRLILSQRQNTPLIGKILIQPNEGNDMFRFIASNGYLGMEFESAKKFELPDGKSGFVERIEMVPVNPSLTINDFTYIDIVSNEISKTIIHNAFVGSKPALFGDSPALPMIEVSGAPNPFSSSVNFTISPLEDGVCLVEIVDAYGNNMGTVFNAEVSSGSTYNATFNNPGLIPGTYYCRTYFNFEFYQDVLICVGM